MIGGRDLTVALRITADGKVAVSELKGVEDAVKRSGEATRSVEPQVGRLHASMGNLAGSVSRTTAALIGPAAAVAGLIAFGKAVFDAGLESQKFGRMLEFVGAGAGTTAAREMAFLRKTVRDLGLDFNTAAEGFTKLAAAANGTALAGQGARDIFVAVSKASTAMGLSAGETQGALLAISQMMSKGTVSAEELRGQLGERLPGAFQIAARAMGVTTAELGKLLESGSISAEEMLPKLAAEMEKTFGKSADSAASSAQAQINRLATEWDLLKQSLADTGAMDAAAKGIGLVSAALRSLSLDSMGAQLAERAAMYEAEGRLDKAAELRLEAAKKGIDLYADYSAKEAARARDIGAAEEYAESRRAAQAARLNAYIGTSKAGQAEKARAEATREYAKAVEGAAPGTEKFARALATLNEKLGEIDKKEFGKPKKTKGPDVADQLDQYGFSGSKSYMRFLADEQREAQALQRAYGEDMARQAEQMRKTRFAGSKEYMEFLKEEFDFENAANRELANDRKEAERERARQAKQAADEAAREWQQTSETIERSLTDALMRGFEGGKDWAKNFVDSLKNMFASLVLRPIIQPIAQAGANALLGAIGMQAPAGAASGLGGASSMLSAGSSLASLGGGLTGLTWGAADALAMTGSSAGLIAADTLVFGASGGASTAAALGSTGISSALGAVATAAPYVAAIAAIGSLIYSAIKQGGGPKSGGSVSDWAIPERIFTPSDADQQIQQMLSGVKSQYADIVKQFGATSISPQFALGYDTDPLGTAQNRINSAAMLNGQMFSLWDRTYGRGEGELQAGLGDQLSRLLVAALRETDLSDEANALLDALDPATASAAQLAEAMSQVTGSLSEAAEQAEEAARQTKLQAQEWLRLARGVIDTRLSLAGGDLSPLSPQARLSTAAGVFGQAASRAALGDKAAFGELSGAASGYLEAARGYYASGTAYAGIYQDVQAQLERAQATALRQASINGAGSIDDLLAETRTGNLASEAGIKAMIDQLKAISAHLSAIEAANALAAAA